MGDADAAARRVAARRVAAASFGTITSKLAAMEPAGALQRLTNTAGILLDWIGELKVRQVDERHGLLLSFAAVSHIFPDYARRSLAAEDVRQIVLKALKLN